MTFQHILVSLAALLAFSPTTQGYTTPCIYQEYKCGYALVTDNVYNNTELTDAVNKTTIIPPLSPIQLLQVLYRCEDVNGTLAGNSFCIAGCISMNGTEDDQCAL
ncbi:uncharacterized protein TRIVIDRAFT_32688 [Trichoderma virens Gv29-8]|uniref:Cellulose signaling related protein ooc1 n=1 Tax=Hypocrea virens (strain Gv29-8 / FGSC 10586) TaxID=413071 RepID=G9MK34_HYPVG|nr:uncharacterized protein TRIVIDRAFT_32688 [Trichoderma virens Gv29-8]EHK25839.1 hypothetical protein TRIVIDRAFT_32688 [Trichoderma virens Gv29-8]UKZ48336.1 hypothetical protein TrVGV298_002559 [Trichoderma virens]UKZ74874.1 hypothetical protein TrVFT333_002544 [Trichoderma virens FT-333]